MKLKTAIFILIMFTSLGCSINNGNEILIQTGAYRLTYSDYKFIRNSAKNKGLTDKQLQRKIVEESRMLAYALDHEYDTIEILTKQLEYAKRYYASRVDGYVWNKKVKPHLELDEDDIHDAYRKQSHEYNLEVIHFPNERVLNKYCKTNVQLTSKAGFYSIKEKVSSDSNIEVYSYSARYPFYPLGVYLDEIEQARIGEVWGPFETLNGYYIVHVGSKRRIFPSSFEEEKGRIRQELRNGLSQKFIWESQQKIFRETKPQMRESAINEMAAKFEPQEKTWPGVDRSKVLMEYYFQGKRNLYTVTDFIEFTHCQPVFFGSLSVPGDIRKMLKSFLIDIYLFAEAQQMGMERDEEYLRFVKRYQHRIFLQHYKQQHILPKLMVSEGEIDNYYQENSDNISCFESASLSVFKFDDRHQAFNSRRLIMNRFDTTSSSADLKKIELPKEEKMEIHIYDSANPRAFVSAILKLDTGEVSLPVEAEGKYCVVYLASKAGTVTKPYQYAHEDIRQLLYSKKKEAVYAQVAEELEAKYPFKINSIGHIKLK